MSEDQQYPIPAVGGFILNSKNQIFLIRSFKWDGYYSVPGGKIQVGESMEDALKREMKEETGLDIEVIKLLYSCDAIYPKEYYKRKHFIFNEFLCRAKNDIPKIDNKEIQSFEWTDLKQALNMNLDSFTRKTIEKYIISYMDKNSKKQIPNPK